MKIEKHISEFVGGLPATCPFCKLQMIRREHRTIIYCPMGKDVGPYCPYFFEIKQAGITETFELNVIEIILDDPSCRVWISVLWKDVKTIKIGEFNDITCVLLPIENASLSNMEQFKRRIKTILTFQ